MLSGCATEAAGSLDDTASAPAASVTEEAKDILRASFEPASADCNGWTTAAATSIRSIPARDGERCGQGVRDGRGIEDGPRARARGRGARSLHVQRVGADAFRGACIRSRDRDGDEPAGDVGAARTADSDGDGSRHELLVMYADHAEERFALAGIEASAAAGDCLLVDDVALDAPLLICDGVQLLFTMRVTSRLRA